MAAAMDALEVDVKDPAPVLRLNVALNEILGDGTDPSHHIFVIKLLADSEEFEVRRTYMQVVTLDKQLRRRFPTLPLPDFPLLQPQRMGFLTKCDGLSAGYVSSKSGDLTWYLNTLAAMPDVMAAEEFLAFLEDEQREDQILPPSSPFRPKAEEEPVSAASLLLRSTPAESRTLMPGRTFDLDVSLPCSGSVIAWMFRARMDDDVGFSVTFNGSPVLTYARHACYRQAAHGIFVAPTSGAAVLHFDNTYSRLRIKLLTYRVRVCTAAELEATRRELSLVAQDVSDRTAREAAIARVAINARRNSTSGVDAMCEPAVDVQRIARALGSSPGHGAKADEEEQAKLDDVAKDLRAARREVAELQRALGAAEAERAVYMGTATELAAVRRELELARNETASVLDRLRAEKEAAVLRAEAEWRKEEGAIRMALEAEKEAHRGHRKKLERAIEGLKTLASENRELRELHIHNTSQISKLRFEKRQLRCLARRYHKELRDAEALQAGLYSDLPFPFCNGATDVLGPADNVKESLESGSQSESEDAPCSENGTDSGVENGVPDGVTEGVEHSADESAEDSAENGPDDDHPNSHENSAAEANGALPQSQGAELKNVAMEFVHPKSKQTAAPNDTQLCLAWAGRLSRFYAKYNREKLSTIADVLERFKGQEHLLFQMLYAKYEIPFGEQLYHKELKQRPQQGWFGEGTALGECAAEGRAQQNGDKGVPADRSRPSPSLSGAPSALRDSSDDGWQSDVTPPRKTSERLSSSRHKSQHVSSLERLSSASRLLPSREALSAFLSARDSG